MSNQLHGILLELGGEEAIQLGLHIIDEIRSHRDSPRLVPDAEEIKIANRE